jgi:hypothetical protein
MRKTTISAILALSVLNFSVPSQAKTTFVTGTLVGVFVAGDGSTAQSGNFTIALPNGETSLTTGCTTASPSGQQVFVFDPTDITDTQTRINMLAVLLAARTSGIPLTVDYDNAGADCDAGGFPIPLFVGF